MYCPQCRSELPDDAKYCIKCGYDFSRIKTPPAHKASSDSLNDIETSIGQEIDTSSFTKGSLFANRYEILDDGKKGGMGAVYKCKDTKLNKIVALKIIHPRLLSSQQALSRFRQEVSISQELQHPNIVKVFNLEEWENKEYFTMEWVEGITLRDIILKRKYQKIPFSIDEAYRIMSQLCDALHYAHQYTVHRDIKPENVLVSDEKTLKVKITDFGIAKMLTPAQLTTTSMKMGTQDYMAPEQKLDAAQVDRRADIYSLGVVLFELLTLENTIGLKLPSKINQSLLPKIDTIIEKALEPKSDDRYADAKELAVAVKGVLAERDRKAEEQTKQKQGEQEKKRQEEERKRTPFETEGQRIAEEEKAGFKKKVIVATAIGLILIGAYVYKQLVSTQDPSPEKKQISGLESKYESPNLPKAQLQEKYASATNSAPAKKPAARNPEVNHMNESVPEVAAKSEHQIEITASDTVWILIKFENGKQEEMLLRSGTSKSLKFGGPAVLKIGNAGGITLKFDGKDLGVLGDTGRVMELTLPGNGSAPNLLSKQVDAQTGARNTRYAVQIGAFKELYPVEALKVSLSRKGYRPYINISKNSKGVDIYKVRLGPLADKRESERLAMRIEKDEHIKAVMVVETD